MKFLEKAVFLIVGIAGMLFLIILGLNLIKKPEEKIEIRGEKNFVLNSILNYVYECFEKNRGKKESVICFQIFINSEKEILYSDIINALDKSRIEFSKVISDDLGKIGEIIIKYENEAIRIEKVEHERIGS